MKTYQVRREGEDDAEWCEVEALVAAGAAERFAQEQDDGDKTFTQSQRLEVREPGGASVFFTVLAEARVDYFAYPV